MADKNIANFSLREHRELRVSETSVAMFEILKYIYIVHIIKVNKHLTNKKVLYFKFHGWYMFIICNK